MTLEELSISYTADVSGAVGAIAALSETVRQASEEAAQAETAFSQAGRQAGAGLAAGIRASEGTVMAAARLIAQRAAAALRDALQIHSPSRVTDESGRRFGDGLAQGMLARDRAVQAAAGSLAGDAADALGKGLRGVADSRGLNGALALGRQALRENGAGEDTFSHSGAAPENARDLNITIPVELDGIQLGIATVNSLNALSRGTGSSVFKNL